MLSLCWVGALAASLSVKHNGTLYLLGRLAIATRAAVGVRPREDVHMTTAKCLLARFAVPRAAICARPLEHLEVATQRSARTGRLIPRAALRTQPLEHLETSLACGIRAGPRPPLTPVGARPLERFEVAFPRRLVGRLFVPRAADSACPAKHREMATKGCIGARPATPRTAVGL